jgi:hypothetical protein
VLTGHGLKHRAELPDEDMVVVDVAVAAKWILHRISHDGKSARPGALFAPLPNSE